MSSEESLEQEERLTAGHGHGATSGMVLGVGDVKSIIPSVEGCASPHLALGWERHKCPIQLQIPTQNQERGTLPSKCILKT